jgi:hypothetical protein
MAKYLKSSMSFSSTRQNNTLTGQLKGLAIRIVALNAPVLEPSEITTEFLKNRQFLDVKILLYRNICNCRKLLEI